jgi:nucleotide-binding universal stress UspA family protein
VINQILVAVDGSPFSLRAARLGAKILQQNTSGVLSLLYIAKLQSDLEWFQGPGSSIKDAPGKERQALEAAFAKGQEILQEAEVSCRDLLKDGLVRVETLVVPGEPAQKIIETAGNKQCEMIIMGSRGAGPLRGTLLGSVSQKVLTNSPCPVLIVK